ATEDIDEYIISKQFSIYTFLYIPFFAYYLNLYTNSIIKEKVLSLLIGTEETFFPLDDHNFSEVIATILLVSITKNSYNKMTYILIRPKLYSGLQVAEKLSIIIN